VFQEEAAIKRRGWSENLQYYTGIGYLGGECVEALHLRLLALLGCFCCWVAPAAEAGCRTCRARGGHPTVAAAALLFAQPAGLHDQLFCLTPQGQMGWSVAEFVTLSSSCPEWGWGFVVSCSRAPRPGVCLKLPLCPQS
jgi:hypothetical protein